MRPQWVLFGDSITQRGYSVGGWANLLADTYQRRVDVINRGYSGYNSRWAVNVLDHVFPLQPPEAHGIQLATVFLGANDAALPTRTS
jgi:lysophospholipase L1-like esterase